MAKLDSVGTGLIAKPPSSPIFLFFPADDDDDDAVEAITGLI
jgi:hypothetical protein